ncbi:beta-ketoacyl synthase N-terminal-like domain-containing protein [Streptomyces sp. NPDC056224]|uniref:beta-ketoacyl synthase N-terminal-like domain-containing protein n=1 Tax=Streptomyces sp. NPDC056224 TaxID=3345750 RepID=UPI0035DF163F
MTALALAGTGLVTALGCGPGAFWDGLRRGARAFGPLTAFEGDFRSRTVAAVRPVDCPAAPGLRKERLALSAARQALRAAGLRRLPQGALVVIVSQALELSADPSSPQAPGRGRDVTGPDPDPLLAACGSAPGEAAVVHLSHACASAAFGAVFAREWLLSGLGTTALVVGASALNPYEYASMDVVRTLSPAGARPFDTGRDGLTVGEGGGAFVLETRAAALDRGHRPQALLSGAACLVGSTHAVASEPGVIRDCMLAALEDAGVRRIDYVHAHATGTLQGDAAEVAAVGEVSRALGWGAVPVSSHKGAVGHLLHASAFPGVVAASAFLREAWVPGTPGLRSPLEVPDGIVPVTDAVCAPRAEHALVNSFGFSGNNAALVVSAVGR